MNLEHIFKRLQFNNCNEFAVFALMSNSSDTNGYYSRGDAYLVDILPITKNTVRRAINSLVDKNYIIKCSVEQGFCNVYQINADYVNSLMDK